MIDFSNVETFAQTFLEAVRTSNWRAAAALGLVAAVLLVRRLGGMIPKVGPLLRSDRGGALLALLLGAAGAAATALLGKRPIDARLLADGLMVGLAGAGGWSVGKKALLGGWKKRPMPRGTYFSKRHGKYLEPKDPAWAASAYEAVTGEAWATAPRADDPEGRRYFLVEESGHREVRIDAVSDDGKGVYLRRAP